MEGENTWSVKVLDWDDEQVPEPHMCTGCVVEFTFGPAKHSYLATSYPYRAEYAEGDKHKIAQQGIPPSVLEKIARLQPRYIMNLAFRPGTDTWFIFCYRTRFAYDAKWEPRKPSRSDSIGETLDVWRTEAKDQVSSCAFGETKDIWFMRSTDTATEWHPEPGPSVPRKALIEFHKALKRQDVKKKRNGEEVQFTKLRAVTFGPNKTWILYSKDTFQWSEHGLPETLIQALTLGQMNKWIINKVVLNPCDPNEYVLVYDHGPVYCSFHASFQEAFKIILAEWSQSMRKYSKYKNHNYDNDYHWVEPTQASFPSGNEEASDVEDNMVTAVRETSNQSPQGILKPVHSRDQDAEKRPNRPRQNSEWSQHFNLQGSPPRNSMPFQEPIENLAAINRDIDLESPISRNRGLGIDSLAHGQISTPYHDDVTREAELQQELSQIQQRRTLMAWNQNPMLSTHTGFPQYQMLHQPPLHAPYTNNYVTSLPNPSLGMPQSIPQYMMYGHPQQPIPPQPPPLAHPLGYHKTTSEMSPERDENQELHFKSNQWKSPNDLVQEQLGKLSLDQSKDDKSRKSRFWGTKGAKDQKNTNNTTRR